MIKTEKTANRYVLDNGMVVILEEKHSAPVVSAHAWIKAGSITEKKHMGAGISHFVEHMLFKGTEKRGIGSIAREIRDAGGNLNGFTSFEFTGYPITVCSSFYETAVDVLSDVLRNSSFDPEECEKERDVILKEINMNVDDPDRYLHNLFFSSIFRTHPYGVPVIGYKEVFNSITREELLAYYKENYVPNNTVFVMVGDFCEKEALESIKKHFGSWKRKAIHAFDPPIEPEQISERYEEREFPAEVARINIGFCTIPIHNPDLAALDTIATILGRGTSSRFVERLKYKEGLVYYIGCSSYTPKYQGVFYIDSHCEEANITVVRKRIWEELERLKTESVPSFELKKAKNQAAAQHIFERETMDQRAMTLASDEIFTGDYLFSENYLNKLASVTSQDIMQAARKYLTQDKETTCVLIPMREEKEEPKKQSVTAEKQVEKIVMQNGATLILKENRETPVVVVNAVLMGGVKFETRENSGIFNILHRMFDKGTKKRTGSDIAIEVDTMGADLETYGGNNTVGCSIKVTKDNTKAGVDLLFDMLLHSSIPQKEFDNVKEIVNGSIKSAEDELLFVSRRKLFELLFPTHPYQCMSTGTLESVKKITREDVISIQKNFIVPGNMVLSVCGDFERDDMLSMINAAFSDTEPQDIPVVSSMPETFPTKNLSAFVPKKKEQTVLVQGFPGMSVDCPDRYVFDVITSILSGMGGRLFSHVRDELGLVYYVGAYNQMGIDPGAYIFYLGTVPDKIDTARKAVLEEIRKICEIPVPEEELMRAKNTLVGNKKISWQKNSTQAFEIALDELYGLGHDNPNQYEGQVMSVTAEDITRVASKYLTRPHVEVTAGATVQE